MAYPWSLVENLKVVEGLTPQIGAVAAVSGAYISLKNVHKCWVVIQYNQGDATDTTWRVDRATTVAGGSVIAVTETLPIWSNLDCATSDLFVARTAAINYASGAGQTRKVIVFEVDPAVLAATFDCIRGASTTALAVTATVSMLYLIAPRYPGPVAGSPSAVTD